MTETKTTISEIDGICATLGYAPLVIGAGAGIEAIKVAELMAKERGIKVVVIGEPNTLPKIVPQELLVNELELKLTRIRDDYFDYKDGKSSRRERRANERKQKRNRSNGA